LVEVQLFFLARDGILDPREGNLVDLTIADLHLRAHPGQLELEGRENRVEPGSGHRDEDVEGEARVAAPQRLNGFALLSGRGVVNHQDAGEDTLVDRARGRGTHGELHTREIDVA